MGRLRHIINACVLAVSLLAFPTRALSQDNVEAGLPEEQVISFDDKIHDFGDVLLSDGPLKWRYTFKNISSSPIVIHNVISSCGCTSPQWIKSPVKPEEEGYIDVTFTNDQGPYPFDKTLTVYVSGVARPVILRLRGYAHEKYRKPADLFTERIGRIGFRSRIVQLGYVEQGLTKTDKITVANVTNQPVEVSAYEMSQGLTVTFDPQVIPAQGTSKVTLTIDTKAMKEKRWGRQSFETKFIINGQKYPVKLFVQAFIRDNFNGMTPAQIENAASPVPERSYFDFGTVTVGSTVTASFKVSNTGKEPLVIHKIEADKTGLQFMGKSPVTIKPGSDAILKFKFDTTDLSGDTVVVLTLITNSPAKPLVNLFLTGKVTK